MTGMGESEKGLRGQVRDDGPGMLRMAATAWRNTAGWTVGTSLRTSARLLRAVLPDEGSDGRDPERKAAEPTAPSLRERGAELLHRSADVDYAQDTHPAYERILGELAPDEARILRLLADRGPQAAVDVRSGMLPIEIGTELLGLGLSMIAAEAGCRYPDRVHAYLNNLNRLGLVWFSREALRDPASYQVLEAQPEVAEAMQKAKRSHTVRRSIHLTPFGEDFCAMCLPARGAATSGRTGAS